MSPRRHRARARTGTLALTLALACAPRAARAHGGDDHGAGALTTPSASGEHSAAVETELFIAVLKYPPRPRGAALPVRLYLASFASGAPVEGAVVRLEVRGVGVVERARAVSAGVYEGSLTAPDPALHTSAVLTVTAGDAVDLLSLDGLHFSDAPAPDHDHDHGALGDHDHDHDHEARAGVAPWLRGYAAPMALSALVGALLALALGALRRGPRGVERERPSAKEAAAASTEEQP